MLVTARELRRTLVVLLVLLPLAFVVWAGFPICPTAAVLGIPCPGCGLTRATLALLHGDLRGALRFHPLVLVIAPLYIGVIVQAIVSYVRVDRPARRQNPRPWLATRAASYAGGALLVLILGVWSARFLGYFGGPVPVETMREWLALRSQTLNRK